MFPSLAKCTDEERRLDRLPPEWQSVGSLQRRLRNCMSGMRAQPFDYDALENVELELFLMWRARGMPLETPAVRP